MYPNRKARRPANRSPAVQIVRRLAKSTAAESRLYHNVFNDVVQGGRSIKVWNWTQKDYDAALIELDKAGIKANLVRTGNGRLRIHTIEPDCVP